MTGTDKMDELVSKMTYWMSVRDDANLHIAEFKEEWNKLMKEKYNE